MGEWVAIAGYVVGGLSLLKDLVMMRRNKGKAQRTDIKEDVDLKKELYEEVERVYQMMLPIKREMEEGKLLNLELQSKMRLWQDKATEAQKKYQQAEENYAKAMAEVEKLKNLLRKHNISF